MPEANAPAPAASDGGPAPAGPAAPEAPVAEQAAELAAPAAPGPSPTKSGEISVVHLSTGEKIRVAGAQAKIEEVLSKAVERGDAFVRFTRAEGEQVVTVVVAHITHFFAN